MILTYAQPKGAFVSGDMFGGNLIFTQNTHLTNFGGAMDLLGVNGLRYPGGSVAEHNFDVRNPDSPHDENGTLLPAGSFIPMTDFLTFAASTGQPATIVLPTRNLLVGHITNLGPPREVDPAAVADIAAFVTDLLTPGGRWPDATIRAFEIGNEYWASGNMTAREYGRVVNAVAQAVQAALDALHIPEAQQPDILAQMGGPWDIQYGTGGIYQNLTWAQRLQTCNTDIISEITSPASRDAIDGLLEHYYYRSTIDPLNYSSASVNYIDTDFRFWRAAGYGDRDLYITEWNIESANLAQLGLKGSSALIEMMENMVQMGVDVANVWPVQLCCTSDLAGGSVDVARLSPLGAAFRLMAESLPGTQVLQSNIGSGPLEVNAFASRDAFVFFVMSRVATTQVVSLDLDEVVTSYSGLTGTRIGFDPASADGWHFDPNAGTDTDGDGHPNGAFVPVAQGWAEHDTWAVLTEFTAAQLGTAGNLNFTLAPYEVMRLVFTVTNNRTLSGTTGANTLAGAAGHDSLTGLAGNDTLTGSGGNDTLLGGDGADVLSGGAGNDRLDGGAGLDMVSYAALTTAVTVNLGLSAPQNTGDGFDHLTNIEDVTGGRGNDLLTGTSGNNVLSGGGGNDTLYGGDGADQIHSGAGNNRADGGAGNDLFHPGSEMGNETILGGAGVDTIVFGDVRVALTVNLATTTAQATGLGNFLITGVENLTGGLGNDVLTGSSGANALRGGEGNDTLSGGDGNDSLYGGRGNDVVFGGGGNDIIFKGGDLGGVYLGGGTDTLAGGAGLDRFVFGNQAGWTKITDFQRGIDKIQMTQYAGGLAGVTQTYQAKTNGMVLTFEDGTIVLENIGNAPLSAGDFLFA